MYPACCGVPPTCYVPLAVTSLLVNHHSLMFHCYPAIRHILELHHLLLICFSLAIPLYPVKCHLLMLFLPAIHPHSNKAPRYKPLYWWSCILLHPPLCLYLLSLLSFSVD